MQQYLDLLSDVLMNGEHKTDRTGTGTISVFGRSMRFDLSEGFPLLTTKKLNLKAIIYELLWMTQGRTDLKYLQDNGVHIWDNWAKEDGTIGRGYGYQFRRHRTYSIVTPVIYTPESASPPPTMANLPFSVDLSRNAGGLVGKTFNTTNSGPITVLKEMRQKNRKVGRRYSVGFNMTGNITEAYADNIKKGEVKDWWAPSVYGIGFYGDFDKNDPYYELKVAAWRGMLERCYSEGCQRYAAYGGAGIHVAPNWLNFANFQKDVEKLPC